MGIYVVQRRLKNPEDKGLENLSGLILEIGAYFCPTSKHLSKVSGCSCLHKTLTMELRVNFSESYFEYRSKFINLMTLE